MNDKIAENIDINMAAVADFCQRWHISEMALFGSVLRDDFAEDSDVDVMVSFELGKEPSFMTLRDAKAELSSLVKHDVSISTRDAIMWRRTLPSIRESILSTAEVIYANP